MTTIADRVSPAMLAALNTNRLASGSGKPDHADPCTVGYWNHLCGPACATWVPNHLDRCSRCSATTRVGGAL